MAETTLPALDGHDGLLGLDDAEVERDAKTISEHAHMSARIQPADTAETRSPDTVVNVNLPLVAGDTAGLGVVHGVDASREMELTSGLLVAGDTDDGALGAVLGDEAGRDTAAVGQLGLYRKQTVKALTWWRGR